MNVKIVSTGRYSYEVSVDDVTGSNISNGVRCVYRVGDYIVKFTNPDNSEYRHDELAVWNKLEECDKEYFAPILEQTDDYVVQAYVELSDHDADNDEATDKLDELQRKYHLNDLHSGNWDTTPDGKLIIFDYALGAGSHSDSESRSASYSNYCHECGTGVHDYDVCFADDGAYCESCYNDKFFYCPVCEADCSKDDEVEIHDHRKYTHVCESCAKNELGAIQCEDCEKWHVDDYVIVDDSNSVYCGKCADKNDVFHCDDCGENFEYQQACNVCEPQDDDDTDDDAESSSVSFPDLIQSEQSITIHWQGSLQTFENIRVWKVEGVSGLFIYHARQIDTDSNNFYVIHEASGLATSNALSSFKIAALYLSKIGTLTDWSVGKDEIQEAIKTLRTQVFKIRQELDVKGR